MGLSFYPKISPNVIKRYESSIDQYFFYNAKNKTFWNCDSTLGMIVSCFDGSLCYGEILNIIYENNPETDKEEILKRLKEIIDFLLKEGFIYET